MSHAVCSLSRLYSHCLQVCVKEDVYDLMGDVLAHKQPNPAFTVSATLCLSSPSLAMNSKMKMPVAWHCHVLVGKQPERTAHHCQGGSLWTKVVDPFNWDWDGDALLRETGGVQPFGRGQPKFGQFWTSTWQNLRMVSTYRGPSISPLKSRLFERIAPRRAACCPPG